jgi:hypothetical protein
LIIVITTIIRNIEYRKLWRVEFSVKILVLATPFPSLDVTAEKGPLILARDSA